MENFLYAIRNAKEIKTVDISFDLYRYSLGAAAGDLLITHDSLLGMTYYYLFQDVSKKYDPSWKNLIFEKNSINK